MCSLILSVAQIWLLDSGKSIYIYEWDIRRENAQESMEAISQNIQALVSSICEYVSDFTLITASPSLSYIQASIPNCILTLNVGGKKPESVITVSRLLGHYILVYGYLKPNSVFPYKHLVRKVGLFLLCGKVISNNTYIGTRKRKAY